MDATEFRDRVREMHELVMRGEYDMDRRTDADATFRTHYAALRDGWGEIPLEAATPVEKAFLALVGDDDWTTARHCLSVALERLG